MPPPPQHMLTSKIRGFVCRSCSSKLQTSRPQRAPLALRSFSSAVAIQKEDRKDGTKKPRQKVKERERLTTPEEVNFYEQYPDGTRKRIDPDNNEEELGWEDKIERQIDVEEDATGKSVEEMVGVLTGDAKDVEKAMLRNMSRLVQENVSLAGLGPTEEQWAEMESHSKEMRAQRTLIESYGGIENMRNLSAEEKLKIREILLAPMRKAMSKARYIPKVVPVPETHNPWSIVAPVKAAKGKDIVLTQESLLIPVHLFPEHARARITQLNNALFPTASTQRAIGRKRRVQSKTSKPKEVVQDIWRAYILCRKSLMDGSEHISQRTWQALWHKLAEEGPHNLDRMGHIKYLGDDMKRSCVPLTPHQHLLYIEALFIDDDRAHAIQAWEDVKLDSNYHLDRLHSSHGNKRSFQLAYWELGIRMFSFDGQAEKAFEAAEIFYKLTKDPGAYRTLLPILRAYLREKEGQNPQRAWALYVQMKLRLGTDITMDDYDNIITAFMDGNQPYLALGVFKDMMLTPHKALAHQDSAAPYKEASDAERGLATQVKAIETDWKDEKMPGQLPTGFNNKFFFGKWIKKLIGEGDLVMAKKVFDLMVDRRIVPAPKYLNGLIGAWIREGYGKSKKMADDTAWRMIRSRIAFVEKRSKMMGLKGPVRTIETIHSGDHNEDLTLTPHATIETFCILIQQYRTRQRDDLTMILFNALGKAQVKANVTFLNELLLSNPRTHSLNWKWKAYRELTEAKEVRPNLETFTILWNLFMGAIRKPKRNLARAAKKEQAVEAAARAAKGDVPDIHDDLYPGVDESGAFLEDVDPDDLEKVYGRDLFDKRLPDAWAMPTAQELFGHMLDQLTSVSIRPVITKELYNQIILGFSLAEDQVGTAVALRALRLKFNMLPTADTVKMIVYQLTRTAMETSEISEEPTQLRSATQERISQVTQILEKFRSERMESLRERGIDFLRLSETAKLEETEMLLSDLLKYVARVQEVGNGDVNGECRRAAERMAVPDCVPWGDA